MTLNELQQIIKKFVEDRNIGTSTENRMLDLLSESGELAKEVLKSSDYGKQPFESNDAFRNEFGHVLFSLVCLANQTDLNLEEVINESLIKFDKRFKDHKHIGSVNKKGE